MTGLALWRGCRRRLGSLLSDPRGGDRGGDGPFARWGLSDSRLRLRACRLDRLLRCSRLPCDLELELRDLRLRRGLDS